jgi:hypothetical protein
MQAETMHVRPSRAGLRVIDPATRKPLPEHGYVVPCNGYWTRRVQQGDCIQVEIELIVEPEPVQPQPPDPDKRKPKR